MSIFWPFDFTVLNHLQEIRTNFLDFFFTTITHLGDAGLFWIGLGLLLCFFVKTRKSGSTMLLALIFGAVVCNIFLKNIVARPRPYTIEEWSVIKDAASELLIGVPHDWAFPSGHTTSSFAAATALFCYHKKSGIVALVLAVLIAFSRLYLYVHYPTDVIAGMLIGICVGIAAFLIFKILCKGEKTGPAMDKYFNYSPKKSK